MKTVMKSFQVDMVLLEQMLTFNRRAVATTAIVLSLSILAFTISYYQLLGESPDYQNYEQFFNILRVYGQTTAEISRFEPGFFLLSLGLVSLFASNSMVFSVMVAGAIVLKVYVIHLFTNNPSIVCIVALFYFARYFPLHELTQIRASLAIALLLLATWFIWNERRLYGLLLCFLASAFHLSAIFVAPILFMRSSRRTLVVLIAAAVFLGIAMAGGLFVSVLEGQFSVVEMYQLEGFGEQPNMFSSALLLDWAMIVTGFFMWKTISVPMKNVLFLQLVGMAVFYAAMDFPVIAHRMRELISVFWLIYVSQGLQRGTTVKIACAVFAAASIMLYSYLYAISGRLFS